MLPAPPGPERGDDDGGEVDRISALPEDLLRRVLINLKCAREAARTSVLARHWRGLWTDLPEYVFDGIEPEAVEAALAQVTRATLDYLGIIKVDLRPESALTRASSLLRAAALFSPVTVNINLYDPVRPVLQEEAPIELPCFDRTRTLIVKGVPLAPPPAGEFSMLEVLQLSTDGNIFAALLPSCPRLRVLRILAHRQLKEVTVHSTTLEELEVERTSYLDSRSTNQIDIDAPELKKSTLDVQMARDFSLTFSAPKVEQLDWTFSCFGNVGLGDYRLMNLNYNLSQGVRTLELAEIDYLPVDVPDRSFAEEVARLGVSDFSVLKLLVRKNGHAVGPLLLDLLQIRPAIQKLIVVVEEGEVEGYEEEELCPQNCPCREPINWKTESVALFDLEEVSISYDFQVGDEEIDVLKLLFRCAPGLKSMHMDLKFFRVEVSDKFYEKICTIFKENPHVKCEFGC